MRRLLFALCIILAFSACSKTIGWGVLLWSADEPAMPPATVVPVYVRSNIEHLWIVGVPEQFRAGEKETMAEIPLAHLELLKNKKAAEKRAEAFGEYALTYAKTLQDGLPVRKEPENNAQRVYRLKQGEIIKVLEKVKGVEAISSTGAPLPGDWLKVLTENGATGFCFSYRLELFEHSGGVIAGEKAEIDTSGDEALDILLSRNWYPESWGAMVKSGRIDTDELAKKYGFDPGAETRHARVYLPGTDIGFPYTGIKKTGERSWNFEGARLRANLKSESSLVVSYEDAAGGEKSAAFVTLPQTADNLINRENERRQSLYQAIYVKGPAFRSVNYGVITLSSDGRFAWDGTWNLPAGFLSEAALNSGTVDMGRFLDALPSGGEYDGALALVFDTVSGVKDEAVFLYSLETQGLRLESVPKANVAGRTVMRRDPEALVMYFSAE